MHISGTCHCGAVAFRVEAPSPVPFMRCYCSICRKTAGGGGYAINLGALADTLEVEGEAEIGIYHARLEGGGRSAAGRRFCRLCGSALWLWDPHWPELVHPHASAIDTPLPEPPERVHGMLASCPDWVQPNIREGDQSFDALPEESLADWHARHGLGG